MKKKVQATSKIDPREGKEGKYLSALEGNELAALQKRKTIFMLLSTLFFGASLFMPVGGRTVLAKIPALSTVYLLFDIFLIVLSVYVSYQGQKKHKLRAEVYRSDAPKKGFDKATYFSYELFNAAHFLMAAAEITIGCLKFEVWGILNFAAAIASVVFSVLSRQLLFHANAGHMEFLPVPGEDEENAKDGAAAKDGIAQTDKKANKGGVKLSAGGGNNGGYKDEADENSAAEDFYAAADEAPESGMPEENASRTEKTEKTDKKE